MSSFQPKGWHTVTPRIITDDVAGLVNFLKVVFEAQGDAQTGRPTEIRIGDSIIMVSDGGGLRSTSQALFYIYVPDADATWRRAIDAGASSIEAPVDTPYGARRAMVEDRWGNSWQIATHRGD